MTGEDFTKALACRLAFIDGRSANEMLAVLFVFRNRVSRGWFGGDWLRNLNAYRKFGSALPRSGLIDLRDPELQKVLQAVDAIYSGALEDRLTAGAVYYVDARLPELNKWLHKNVVQRADLHPRVATVGNLIFFQ